MTKRKRIPAYPYQIRIDDVLRVDEKLARAIRERACACDRRIGWEMIRLIKAALADKSVPEEIGWGYSKLTVNMRLPVEYIDDRMLRKIRAGAIAHDRTMSGEVVHLLKAAIIAECLNGEPDRQTVGSLKPVRTIGPLKTAAKESVPERQNGSGS
jgi:hypothetical protein